MKYGLVVAALLLVWSGVAHAYTVTVNSFTDDVAAGGSCSVREALVPASAVANGCVLEGSADEPPSVCDEPQGAASSDDSCNATAQGLSLWPVALLVLTASMLMIDHISIARSANAASLARSL